MKPYGISSDQHCHSWSQFSRTNGEGVNSRLQIILDELKRSARAVLDAGGDTLYLAGDLFHVRGKIEPSVFNPTYDTFREIAEMGVTVRAIPGNHDLEGANADRLGNSMQQLDEIEGFESVTEPTYYPHDSVVMLPWYEDLTVLEKHAKAHAKPDRDLIIHAPLNGVIRGIPDLGLDPAEVAKWGYRRVFCGHYHNHVEFQKGQVYSIGATTHQTWSDPGTRAGFLIIGDDVQWVESSAPKFVNVDKPSQITPEALKGNYARLRFEDVEEKELLDARAKLADAGVAGFVDHSSKKRPEVRPNVANGKNVTLEASVGEFSTKHLQGHDNLDKDQVAKMALDVLSEARQVGGE